MNLKSSFGKLHHHFTEDRKKPKQQREEERFLRLCKLRPDEFYFKDGNWFAEIQNGDPSLPNRTVLFYAKDVDCLLWKVNTQKEIIDFYKRQQK